MTTAPQIPSHLRFMIAGIQDRALDLALGGQVGVKAELDVADEYALFWLVTRPGYCGYSAAGTTRLEANLSRIVGISSDGTFEAALDDARQQFAAMIDHLEALIALEASA